MHVAQSYLPATEKENDYKEKCQDVDSVCLSLVGMGFRLVGLSICFCCFHNQK